MKCKGSTSFFNSFKTSFFRKNYLSSLNGLALLLIIIWWYMQKSKVFYYILIYSIDLYVFFFFFFCQHCADLFAIALFVIYLDSWSVRPPILFFFFKTVLSIPYEFRFSISAKKSHQDFDIDVIESLGFYTYYWHFNNIKSSDPWQRISFFRFVYLLIYFRK